MTKFEVLVSFQMLKVVFLNSADQYGTSGLLFLHRYQSNTANTSLDTILSIQPKDSSSGGGETRESVVYKQAADMLEKLPPNYIPHEVKARLQKMGAIAPMNIFLRQEIDRMQRVITIVRNTLKDLRLAIEGTIIMSEVRH